MAMPKNTPDDFWAKVDRNGPTPEHRPELGACWVWTLSLHPFGYGRGHLIGMPRSAHRIAWVLTYGSIPDGLFVCHKCDNPSCCNPSHLFTDTQAGNMRDKVRKGRQASGDANGARTRPETRARGESNGFARVTESIVREIRARHASGEPSRRLARAFGVCKTTVLKIVNRETWKHVT